MPETGVTLHSKATTADFFVHPDYYRSGGSKRDYGGVYEDYEEAIRNSITDASLPILIHDPSVRSSQDSGFWDRFPAAQRYPTQRGGGKIVSEDEQYRLNETLREYRIVTGVVHGSYLEACVAMFRNYLVLGPGGTLEYQDFPRILGNAGVNNGLRLGVVLGLGYAPDSGSQVKLPSVTPEADAVFYIDLGKY